MTELLGCPMCGGAASIVAMEGYQMAMCECGVNYEGPDEEDCAEAWNRRTAAPVAEGVALPPPKYPQMKMLTHGDVSEQCGYTAEQVRQAQREAYELGKRASIDGQLTGAPSPVKKSIDTPEFQSLLRTYCRCLRTDDRAALIAYIDGRTAGTAPEGYALAPLEPTEAMLKAAVRAFQSSYNDADTLADWREAYKASIAAAPSPLPPQEEAK